MAAWKAGALGGLGGVATTLVDLPVTTTTLILRSIQPIAQGCDEDTASEKVRAQCLAVFAFGGQLVEDDEAETGLFAVRVTMTGGRDDQSRAAIEEPSDQPAC